MSLVEDSENYSEESLLLSSLADENIEDFDFSSHDINATMLGMVHLLVERARNAATSERSFSYRGFLVGASAIAYDASRIGTFTSGNFKAKLRDDERTEADVEDIPKFCSEMDINMRASMNDFERIGIIVVAATTNRDRIRAVTRLAGETLEPCDECESVLRHSDLVDDQTIIMTIGSGEDKYQVQNFKSLTNRYKMLAQDKAPPKLKTYRYSDYVWEDRQRRYIEARDAESLEPSTLQRKKRAEKRCRELALAAMVPGTN